MELEHLPEFQIDKYVHSRELGVGAFGMVFLFQIKDQEESNNLQLPKEVAVKTFRSKECFEVEAKNLERISGPLGQHSHPNLVRIYGQCYLSKEFCIVMEKYDKPLSSLGVKHHQDNIQYIIGMYRDVLADHWQRCFCSVMALLRMGTCT